ncbi:uncharacterized protein [Ambystoma mexicanum]|uniref:uncharacterized protein n=1 Tax=Ambystoma mexicanum TaxID=8296 RepID=UPI0037E857B5
MRNPTQMDLEIELRNFFRKVRLKDYFGSSNPEPTDEENTPFHLKSTFTPTSQMVSPETVIFERSVLRDFHSIFASPSAAKHNRSYNFSKREWDCLQNLKGDPSIVIKQADKGGGVVVCDSTYYDSEVMRQLNSTSFYLKLRGDPTDSIRDEILALATRARDINILSPKEFQYLTIKGTRAPLFYILPKIHKDRLNPPGRPIVSLCGSILEPLGKYLNFFLKPLAAETPTYLADTTDAIVHLEGLPFDTAINLFITLDVESLYSNIPQLESLPIIKFFLDMRSDPQQVPSEFLIDLLEIALTKNYFRFKEDFFLQVKGTAMGASFAPNYATLFMWAFEKVSIFDESNPYLQSIIFYRRYIDDIIIIWDRTSGNHETFLTWMNSLNDHLRFTMTSDNMSIPFLDLLLKAKDGAIAVDLYRKPTDRNTILHFESFHPQSLRVSIPYGQFLRARRNCTDKKDFAKQADIIEDRLMKRGYPHHVLRQSRKRARHQHREILLTKNPREKSNQSRMVCAMTYNTHHSAIKKAINKHWHLLQLNHSDLALPMFAFRKGKNLKSWLSKADRSLPLSGPKTITEMWGMNKVHGHFPCGYCCHCGSTTATTTVNINNRVWNLRDHTTCNSKNVIYAITCPCDKTYIGKTSRPVKLRISEHKSKIRTGNLTSPLALHFVEHHHDCNDLRWWALEQIRGFDSNTSANRLSTRENWWIYNTQSHIVGLNSQEEWAAITHISVQT